MIRIGGGEKQEGEKKGLDMWGEEMLLIGHILIKW